MLLFFFFEMFNRHHKAGEHLCELLAAQANDKLLAVFFPRLIDRRDKLGMEVKPLPPTVFAIRMARLIDDIHLVTTVNERDVPNREILST